MTSDVAEIVLIEVAATVATAAGEDDVDIPASVSNACSLVEPLKCGTSRCHAALPTGHSRTSMQSSFSESLARGRIRK